jgi:hypothetical protein
MKTDFSEQRAASNFRVEIIHERRIALAVSYRYNHRCESFKTLFNVLSTDVVILVPFYQHVSTSMTIITFDVSKVQLILQLSYIFLIRCLNS